MLSPSKKVQALLAQFSASDSSDNDDADLPPKALRRRTVVRSMSSESESEVDQIDERSRSDTRIARRLLASETKIGQNTEGPVPTTDLQDNSVLNIQSISATDRDSGFQTKASTNEEALGHSSSEDFQNPPIQRVKDHISESKTNTRAKLQALASKRRNERLQKEAEEVVEQVVGSSDDTTPHKKRVRGSSPADDSSEEDGSADDEAAKRIQKEARPTRKASKKALEEMHRETQRMSRNMQLTHQARTRTTISKESLLSRFGFGSSGSNSVSQPAQIAQVNIRSSPRSNSDSESQTRQRSTPPTSPLHETDLSVKNAMNVQKHTGSDVVSTIASSIVAVDESNEADELPSIDDVVYKTNVSSNFLESKHPNNRLILPLVKASKLKAMDVHTIKGSHGNHCSAPLKSKGARNSLLKTTSAQYEATDSDSEIEIVKARGMKRKYAAFESLPKRKAKEMPSHLALRSLAYIHSHSEGKRAMNSAELELSLRRRARLQALEERKDKIEQLRLRGVVVQTTEERERDQQQVEDLVERARQEAAEIQKREKELAKQAGTYVKDQLDDEDDDESDSDDADFVGNGKDSDGSASEEDAESGSEQSASENDLIDNEVEEGDSEEDSGADADDDHDESQEQISDGADNARKQLVGHRVTMSGLLRNRLVVSDDDDDDDDGSGLDNVNSANDQETRIEERPISIVQGQSPLFSPPLKTPRSAPRSVRKVIPGLQMSDDLPMGLSQAFAATMAESQTQAAEKGSLNLTADVPSPRVASIPMLTRYDSVDLVSDSQPLASQTEQSNIYQLHQSQIVPESPRGLGIYESQYTPSRTQIPFEFTQDNKFVLSPFTGSRFAETPTLRGPDSTIETVVLPHTPQDSPILQRRSRLQRGKVEHDDESANEVVEPATAFQVMAKASKRKPLQPEFDKKKSEARNIIDEAAEESEDEYAGLGGASDDSGDDEENEDDRRMIDEDTQIGKGDEAKLAGLYADRERQRDEKEVSKLLKDITTGALRRKRGVGDDLDLSDEEDAAARRREAKRREFARMRRELLKDEAVGKIAEDKKKEAFLRSIEDREIAEDADPDSELIEGVSESADQSQVREHDVAVNNDRIAPHVNVQSKMPLNEVAQSKLNRQPIITRRFDDNYAHKPATLAEIRNSVSFLIEEPDSQVALVGLGLSDSEDEPEAYVDLNRHLMDVDGDEDEPDAQLDDLDDFIVNDEEPETINKQTEEFKKPDMPRQERAPFSERRTKHTNVIDRLSLTRQSSSSASSVKSASVSSKLAFFSSRSGHNLSGAPTLLRRATTNSSLGSRSGKENVSATGVVTNRTERDSAGQEKEFIRKGNGGRRNAVNYQTSRKTLSEEKMSARISKGGPTKNRSGFLGGLFRGDSWE